MMLLDGVEEGEDEEARALKAEVYNVSRANLGQVQFQLCTSLVLRCLKVETALMFVDFKEVTFGLKNIS